MTMALGAHGKECAERRGAVIQRVYDALRSGMVSRETSIRMARPVRSIGWLICFLRMAEYTVWTCRRNISAYSFTVNHSRCVSLMGNGLVSIC